MIRFCDMEVFSIYEDEIDRDKLLCFFCSEDHNSDIVIVYNRNNDFTGIITYGNLLYNNKLIQKDKLYVGDSIFDNARNIFNNDEKIIYLPVFDRNGDLVYFCYNDNSKSYKLIDYAFSKIEETDDCLFINEVYPQVQAVYIYDFNEYAFRLYNLLIKRKINVIVIGDKWKIIVDITNQTNEAYPQFARMNILAEPINLVSWKKNCNSKNNFEPVNSFGFLLKILKANSTYCENVLKLKLSSLGANALICRVPGFNDLTYHTTNEYYRNKAHFTPGLDNFKYTDLNIEQLVKLFGDDYNKIVDNHKFESIDSNNDSTISNHFWSSLNTESERYGYGENRVYLIGPCIVYGYCVEYNLAYYLQQYLDKHYNEKFAVITVVNRSFSPFTLKEKIESLSIKENDILIIINTASIELTKSGYKDNRDIDLTYLFNQRPKNEEWYLDTPIHTTSTANKAIAEEIVENYLSKIIIQMNFSREQKWIQKSQEPLSNESKQELYEYLSNIKKFKTDKNSKIGAIVMNCNPFTLGHMYLIEQAIKKVEYLYIFIVEENLSEFPFEDRIKLVQEAMSSRSNIRIIPSGKFVISKETMPIYFEKAKKQDVIFDASKDIEVFARYIAPELNITVRFAGEEPLDRITRQYNQEMRRTLSEFGIKFVEILRKKIDSEVISASMVRKLLKLEDWENLKRFIPDVTFDYLKNKRVSQSE